MQPVAKLERMKLFVKYFLIFFYIYFKVNYYPSRMARIPSSYLKRFSNLKLDLIKEHLIKSKSEKKMT